jgi:hypothetical protein
MQLKPDPTGVRRRLIAASCALLSATAARSQEVSTVSADGGQTDWRFDSALAYDHENGRIQAVEPVVNVSKDYGDGEVLGVNLTLDSLTGSSPNGALTSNKPQTFASPSGKSLTVSSHTYTTDPDQTGRSCGNSLSVKHQSPLLSRCRAHDGLAWPLRLDQ